MTVKRKILFIDRDGTIIFEPPDDFRVDSPDKLAFIPGAISNLQKIAAELDFMLVMVTNQDGLGTIDYPESSFNKVQEIVMRTLSDNNIHFSAVHVDRSFEHEQMPTRKPGTGMLTGYLQGEYDIKNSFVIGDRITDVKLAANLGCGAIMLKNYDKPDGYEKQILLLADNWDEIYRFLSLQK